MSERVCEGGICLPHGWWFAVQPTPLAHLLLLFSNDLIPWVSILRRVQVRFYCLVLQAIHQRTENGSKTLACYVATGVVKARVPDASKVQARTPSARRAAARGFRPSLVYCTIVLVPLIYIPGCQFILLLKCRRKRSEGGQQQDT